MGSGLGSSFRQRRSFWRSVGSAGCVALSILMVMPEPAEAGRRRHHRSGHAAASSRYTPPFASFVIDHNTGRVLHEENADSPRHPASLTKVMTLYLLFEQIEQGRMRLETSLPVSNYAATRAPSKIGLTPGSTIAVEDAIGALVTKSANDAAVVVAEAIGGSEDNFAEMMTDKARALGMSRTSFKNASGLPDDRQVTTARDMVTLGRAIQDRFPKYYAYFNTRVFEYRGRNHLNHNKLLGRVQGVDGIKTGYTRDSGFNLISSLRRDNRHIVAAVMGGTSGASRDAKMRDLLEQSVPQAFAGGRRSPKVLEASAGTTRVAQAKQAETSQSDADSRPATVTERINAATAVAAPVSITPTPAEGLKSTIQPNVVRTISVQKPVMAAAVASVPAAPSPQMARSNKPGELGTITVSSVAPVPAAAVKAVASEPRSPAAPGSWIIQIGAFSSKSEAETRMNSVKSSAKVLAKAQPFTEKVEQGSKEFFRARFAGFDKDSAEQACRALKHSKVSCLAIKN